MITLEDASGFRGAADRLLTPENEQELAAIVREALSTRTPITVRGAGTGVAGGGIPSGGWSVSLERFSAIRIEEGCATAGAGALLKDVQTAAVRSGQFYPPDPTEHSAAIGGTIATNASGSRSFRYGDTRRHVLALRVVTMDGQIRTFERGDAIGFPVREIPAPATRKHSAGFPLRPGMDWIDLFTGSEGTLGIVIEARLRLLPAPGEILAGVVFFPSDAGALNAVDGWRSIPRLNMLEYLDAPSLDLLRAHVPDIPASGAAALLIEQEMEAGDLDRWVDRLDASGALAEQSWFGETPAERERFRRFRHALPEAVNEIVRRRGLLKMGTDMAVPLDRSHEMMAFYRKRLQEEFPGQYVIFGHIGDAHVHANMLPASAEEAARARDLLTEFARKAVSLGGTVSAEHGLGKRKAYLLAIQYAPEHIAAMLAVKHRLDPQALLGPGTLFP